MRLASALALTLLTATAAAAQSGGGGKATLDEVLREHVRAIRARDLPALERTLTAGDQLQIIFADGRRSTTRAEYVAFHRDWFAERGWTIAIRPVGRVERDDLALVTTRTREEAREGTRVTGWSENWRTLTFAREAAGWRLVHDQNTRIRTGP